MKKQCPSCGKEKDSVGPKIVGKTKAEDHRLISENDVLVTKIMCQECYESLDRVQKCLNPNCDAILFITGRLAPDTEQRGVDRNIEFKRDEKGEYVECPKCGAKHTIASWRGPEGAGGRWNITDLR